ncbi:MAG: hypothetical protein AB7H97_17425 [Pseudobdellovibrionaceae bacterium]
MRLLLFSILMAFSILLTACKSENPNPELADPIFKSLNGKLAATRSQIAAEEKTVADLNTDLKEAETYGLRRSQLRKEIDLRNNQLVRLKQYERFLAIRAHSRTAYARKLYKESFAQGKTWPPPELDREYSRMDRLRNAPRTWSGTVPQLEDRTPASVSEPGVN